MVLAVLIWLRSSRQEVAETSQQRPPGWTASCRPGRSSSSAVASCWSSLATGAEGGKRSVVERQPCASPAAFRSHPRSMGPPPWRKVTVLNRPAT